MPIQEDTKAEGVTTFPSTATNSYRYVIFVKHGKLKILLEDRSSKRRWQTAFLQKDDYVTTANVFGDATAADYASLFKQTLGCSLDGMSDTERKLTRLQEDMLRLEFCTSIRLLNSARSIHYAFDLHPIPVDRIEVLEAKMRDHQEALDQVCARVGLSPLRQVYLYAESQAQLKMSQLTWKTIKSKNFACTKKKNAVKALVPGLYVLAVVVNHMPRIQDTGSISLLINGAEIQRATTGVAHFDSRHRANTAARHQTSSSLLCIARVQKDAHIAVACTDTVLASDFVSYLTAVRIAE